VDLGSRLTDHQMISVLDVLGTRSTPRGRVLSRVIPTQTSLADRCGAADEIHIYFPWGSLLRAVAVGEEGVLAGLRHVE
jgi:hypothetical protein